MRKSGARPSGWEIAFPAGQLPELAAVGERLSSGSIPISSCRQLAGSDEGDPVIEYLVAGLAFDICKGIGTDAIAIDHAFGIDPDQVAESATLSIIPSPHISGAAFSLPVVKAGAAIALTVSAMENCQAIIWRPIGSVMEVGYFRETFSSWLDGGPFPAQGLTAFERVHAGEWRSVGLRHILGQELQLAPAFPADRGENFKLAARLIDRMVEYGPLSGRMELETLDGMKIELRATPDGKTIHALPLN